MLWMFESKEYAVILAASFLAGLLMDMILKKVTKQGETKYTAFLSRQFFLEHMEQMNMRLSVPYSDRCFCMRQNMT